MEQARRASIVNEDMRHRRVQKLDVGASSSWPMSGVVSTSDGADRVFDGTTDGVILRMRALLIVTKLLTLTMSYYFVSGGVNLQVNSQYSLRVFLPLFFFPKRHFNYLLNRHVLVSVCVEALII